MGTPDLSHYIKIQLENTKELLISLIKGEVYTRGTLNAVYIPIGKDGTAIVEANVAEVFVATPQSNEGGGDYVPYEDLTVETLAKIYAVIEEG